MVDKIYKGQELRLSKQIVVKEVKHGVPHGLVLGPVLFADDTNIQTEAANVDMLSQKIK